MRISDWSSDVCSSDLLPSRVEFRSSVKCHILHCRNCLLLHRRGNSLPIYNHWKAVLLTIMSKLNHSQAAPMGLFLSSPFIRNLVNPRLKRHIARTYLPTPAHRPHTPQIHPYWITNL